MKLNTKVMGILNITPDSFSDGNQFFTVEAACKQASTMIKKGAHIIDIGAESTRPGAVCISADEEFIRLKDILPEVIEVAKQKNTELSIDTYKPKVAELAIGLGVNYVNDVSGFANDRMIEIVKPSNVKLVVMHNLGVPADKKVVFDQSMDVMDELLNWFQLKTEYLMSKGIAKERIIIDPGLGFGKNVDQSWHILQNIEKLKTLGFEIMIGHSRKSLFSMCSNNLKSDNKDILTLIVSILLFLKNIDYLRVHNVDIHVQALTIYSKFI